MKTKARKRRTMSQQTYHVMRGKRRTTVMVDGFLSAMLALKLGVEPDSEDAWKRSSKSDPPTGNLIV